MASTLGNTSKWREIEQRRLALAAGLLEELVLHARGAEEEPDFSLGGPTIADSLEESLNILRDVFEESH